jgi:hypothetical protein
MTDHDRETYRACDWRYLEKLADCEWRSEVVVAALAIAVAAAVWWVNG